MIVESSSTNEISSIASNFDINDLISYITQLITSPSAWRPGLFDIVIGGRVSDVIGIADVLFPAILAGWGYRFSRSSGRKEVFSSITFGFLIGCVLLEVFQTGSGQPALLYLVPSMIISLLIVGLFKNCLKDMWFGQIDELEK